MIKVVLSALANEKLKHYIDCIEYEISGLGLVEKRDDGSLYVPDIFLLKQEVSGAETDLDSHAVAEFVDEKLQDPDFPIENLKLWWHSHVRMGVFWSGTDVATINRLDTEQSEENWMLSIVGNKLGNRLARLDVYAPHRMWMNELKIEVEEDQTLKEAIKKEIEEKVTIRTLQATNNFPKTWAGAAKRNVVKNDLGEEDIDDDAEENSIINVFVPRASRKLKKGRTRKV